MQFDYSKLLGRLRELGITQEEFAPAIGMSPSTLSLKLNGNGFFNQDAIEKAILVLKINKTDVGAYFFTPKVQKI